jgi:hypothetical protein
MENILAQAQQVLVKSQRVFRYGCSIVIATGMGGEGSLIPLTNGSHVEPSAASHLANLFLCKHPRRDGQPNQFLPPWRFVATLLTREPTIASLPLIRLYARRPVFDKDHRFHGPGWHGDPGILVHSFDVEPVLLGEVNVHRRAIDRLPPHLRQLLGGFCFREDADVANTLAVLLTGILINHFVVSGKPIVLLDGNQPGLGKTLLIRTIGMVLDGEDPKLIHYTPDDEELQKRICATLRSGRQSQVVIDNAKVKAEGALNSPVLEANSMAPEVSLRILGKSENYIRPNDLIWSVTMNNTRASPDLVSRGLPIRQHYEGDPKKRRFRCDPIRYAREHRQEILGELVGMVVRWTQQGRPEGHQDHRLTEWSRINGGVLNVNGFPEFLTNQDDAASQFNTGLDELAALAEAAVSEGGDFIQTHHREEGENHGNED